MVVFTTSTHTSTVTSFLPSIYYFWYLNRKCSLVNYIQLCHYDPENKQLQLMFLFKLSSSCDWLKHAEYRSVHVEINLFLLFQCRIIMIMTVVWVNKWWLASISCYCKFLELQYMILDKLGRTFLYRIKLSVQKNSFLIVSSLFCP